jgi:ferredoxin-NADP reductase
MLHSLTHDPLARPVWFIHGGRDGQHHPLSHEVRMLVAGHQHLHAHVAYSRPRPEDAPGIDFDSSGRIDSELIASLVPDLDAEFYLCGPTPFMAGIQSGLGALGVSESRIHTEIFGPVGG